MMMMFMETGCGLFHKTTIQYNCGCKDRVITLIHEVHAHVGIDVFWRKGDVERAEARQDRARPLGVREEVLVGSSSDTRTGLRLDPTPRACFGLLAEHPEKTAKPLPRFCRL